MFFASIILDDSRLDPLKKINDILIPVRFFEQEIIIVIQGSRRKIRIALMLLKLFELF